MGNARRVDPHAGRPLPARNNRLLRPRPRDDARRGTRPQSIPCGAALLVKFEAPRGTHDILPSEQPLWQRITVEMESVCALYGYARIQTPVFEDVGLFLRTSGEGSDIVQKEMYVFDDRGGGGVAPRPGGAPPPPPAPPPHRPPPQP